jgi:hypothetical protein
MADDSASTMLFVAASDKYGDKYIEHLLEQYKVYLSSAEKISDRRQKANEFFLTLNTGLVAVLGYVSANIEKTDTIKLLILSAIAGIVMCYLWYRMVKSYSGLNSGKFRVIHLIETRLPLALYDTEWETLGRGKDKKLYWPFTHIEVIVPWIFVSLYIFLLIATVPWSRIFICFSR